jgi:hypothetical protein
MKLAVENCHSDLSIIDLEYREGASFGNWLRLAMAEINQAGYLATIDENKMNVFVREI